jgi:hypothetical protein
MLKRFEADTYFEQTAARSHPAARRTPFGDTLHQKPRTRLFGLDLMVSTRAHVAEELVAMAKANERVNIFNLGVDAYCEVNDSIGWISKTLGVTP